MKIHNLLNYMAVLSLVSAFSFFIVLFYWSFYPYKITTVSSSKILNQVIHPGDRLEQQVTYCKYINVKATIMKQIVDHIVLNVTPGVTGNAPLGCHTIVNQDVVIPVFLVKEKGVKIYTTYEYHPNPIRTIIVTFTTQPFNIQ